MPLLSYNIRGGALRSVMTWAEAVYLENEHAVLRPLRADDAADLAEAAETLDTFRYFSRAPGELTPEGMGAFIAFLLEQPNTSAFCVLEPGSGRPVGVTTYLDIREAHRTLEIGWTWYAPRLRGGMLNPACKLLLLRHAFEELGAVRVQLKTDERNARSRAAILKLGATFEGILRHHVIMPDRFLRSTAMYSIIAEEWPGVRKRLEQRLGLAAPTPEPGPATAAPAERTPAGAADGVHAAPVSAEIGRDRYVTTINALGHALTGDEPAALGGTDAGPSPFGLLLSALGACKAITCRMYADRKGYALETMRVGLSMDRRDRDDAVIHAEIELSGDLTDEQRQRLLEIAGKCPVERTLTGTIRVENVLTGL